MSSENTTEKRPSLLEGHVQTVMLALISAGLIGLGSLIMSINQTLIRLEERDKIRSENQVQLQADMKGIQTQLVTVNERLTKLESKK